MSHTNSRKMLPGAWVLAIAAVVGWLPQAQGQAPSISATSPMAIRPGQTTDVKLVGANLTDVSDFWASFPCQPQLPTDIPENGKKPGEVVYRLTVPADVSVGVNAIRVANAGGSSNLKLFVIDDLPTVASVGNNTTPATAQPLTLPVAVDGTVAALTRNYYSVQVQAAQTISLEVLARRIGSPLDPLIRILDAKGREMAYSDDVPGLGSDCRLSYTFPEAGPYLVEVRDIRYQGGGNFAYRLRIGDFPCVTVPYPMGVKRGAAAQVSFFESPNQKVVPIAFTVPADSPFDWLNLGAKREGGGSSGFVSLAVSDSAELLEAEPNDDLPHATRFEFGTSLNGRIDKPGDIDHFVFTAKQGQKLVFTGLTRRQGSPASLYLRLWNSAAGQLVVKEDFGTTDAIFNYAIPADGDYTLSVQDLFRHGGEQFGYRILIQEDKPGFELNAAADTVNVPAAGTAMITVTSVRKGYDGPIAIQAVDLPNGVSSLPTVIGPGMNSVVLTLQTKPDTPAGKIVPIRIAGTGRVGDAEVKAEATISGALTVAMSGVRWTPQNLSDAAALGIAPRAPIRLRAEPAQIVFGRDLSATIKVIAERDTEFDEPITLAVTPPQGGLPGNVAAAVKPIPKGQNEIEVVFTANANAPLGEFTAVLTGTHAKNNVTVIQPVPGIGLKLQEPFKLKTDPQTGKVARGATLNLKVTVERNPAFQGPVELTVQNLPKGVTAANATIAADKTEVEITLTAAQDAQQGAVNNITVNGGAMAGNAKLAGASPAVSLTVE